MLHGAQRLLPLITALLFSSLATESRAGDIMMDLSGNTLFEDCQKSEAFCRGYVMGAAAAAQLRQQSPLRLPTAVTGQQTLDVVKLWLREHPERRHLVRAFLSYKRSRKIFRATRVINHDNLHSP